jgi:hypothetical protein
MNLTCQEQESIATTSMKPHADDSDLKLNMTRTTAQYSPYEYFCMLYASYEADSKRLTVCYTEMNSHVLVKYW